MTTIPHHATPAAAPSMDGGSWHETLNDGTPVLVRTMCAADRVLEEEFLDGLSADAKRRRFFYTFKETPAALLDRLMDVDDANKVALLAISGKHHPQEVGVARYTTSEQPGRCEFAVTVADRLARTDLDAVLLSRLIALAQANRVTELFAIEFTTNRRMHQLAERFGFSCAPNPEDATTVIYSLRP